ncbi:hypothetical protein KR018_009033, partial [Drosophila ironensis]
MSSAHHYQALRPHASDEDIGDMDMERLQRSSSPRPMGRKGRVGRPRYLVPLLGCVLFIVAFCYLTFSMDTRLALGLGGGSDAESEEGAHHGAGKKRTKISFNPVLVEEAAEVSGRKFKIISEESPNELIESTYPNVEQEKKIDRSKGFKMVLTTEKVEESSLGLVNERYGPLHETLTICNQSFEDRRLYIQDQPQVSYDKLPVIYFVTPTYPRREQVPELTRLAHTLLHVPRLHWLVADDREKCNGFLDNLLGGFGIPFTHLVSPMPAKFRNEKPAPRGVANRRAALQWLRQQNHTNGVLYFGDDDNTYDLKLFSEIRTTQAVSMFPVGLISDYGISGPVVRKGKVVAFLDSWIAGRRWPVDMAGFAVNLKYMSAYGNANMPYKPGYEEDLFLRSLRLRIFDIEPRGNNCTEILVWHTQTKSKKISTLRIESKYLDNRSNLGALLHNLEKMGVALTSETEG